MKLEEWYDRFCTRKRYHGGTFTGGDCQKLLENIDDFERMLIEDECWISLRFRPAFKALDTVQKACFGQELQDNWIEKLDHLKEMVKDLRDDDDIKISCTLKFQILFSHFKFWCEIEKLGLGTVSAQTGESMNSTFDKNLEMKNNDLLLAVRTKNSESLWAQPDDAGDQN